MSVADPSSVASGFDIPLSDTEFAYLRAAGVAPQALNTADRAAVIRAIINSDPALNPDAEGLLALIYKCGILRAMLLHQGEKRKEAHDKKEKDAKERKKEEERRLQQEFDLYRSGGARAYVKTNPLPIDMLRLIASGGRGLSPEVTSQEVPPVSPLAGLMKGYDPLPHMPALPHEDIASLDPSRLKPLRKEEKVRVPPVNMVEKILSERADDEKNPEKEKPGPGSPMS